MALQPTKVNVFIGRPNAGKSNILEAFGLLSCFGYGQRENEKEFVRFEQTDNLFYEQILDEPMEIRWDDHQFSLQYKTGSFQGSCVTQGQATDATIYGSHDSLANISGDRALFKVFKFYRFKVLHNFPTAYPDHLVPPSGDNLMSLIRARSDLRKMANDVLAPTGLRLLLKPQENKMEVVRRYEDIDISYPYALLSDTLQRMIFNLVAVRTNKDSVLVFEEPEAHAFPYYTKHLAETIALDENNNQYFISTHNPYFLLPLLEKAPKEQISVYLTYYKDFQTRVKRLSKKELVAATEVDLFSNLEWFVKNQ